MVLLYTEKKNYYLCYDISLWCVWQVYCIEKRAKKKKNKFKFKDEHKKERFERMNKRFIEYIK